MRTLPGLLTAYCISLLSTQLLALRTEQRADPDRSDIINSLMDVSEDAPPPSPSFAPGPLSKWLTSLLRDHPPAPERAHPVPSSLSWAHPSSGSPLAPLKLQRSRRHLISRGTHHHSHHQAQLMRVGCNLGTCQVQNLSHRLYQLIGQSGREDSSPINPRSPHSYG